MADASPWLIVGLGNPGPTYANNRHNVGFRVVERWVEQHLTPGTGPAHWREQFKGRVVTVHAAAPIGRCVVLQPQTYMNRSGASVRAAADFHRVELERIVVVHDEIDFEFGRLALKRGGGHGGHNGLRDLVAQLGKPDFFRVRVGVGRPQHGEVSSWVLADFAGEDAGFVPELLDRAEQALSCLLAEGLAAAMNRFHRTPASPTSKERAS